MPVADWDKNEIKKLAQASGKPLEVRCAEAFLKAGWHVSLGTFYSDVLSEKIRELDVLIEKSISFEAKDASKTLEWILTLRVLGSCKGFPADHGPATYSVLANSSAVQKPHFLSYDCTCRGGEFAAAMSHACATRFLHKLAGSASHQIVGFDILHRKEDSKARVEYVRKTDRDLYEGLDSALKAAIYWFQEDRRQKYNRMGGRQCHIVMNIPLLVSSLPFWDVSIEQGGVREPELKSSGFHVSLYPSLEKDRPPAPIMSIVWDAARLDDLTSGLDDLLTFFADEARLAAERS